MGAYQIVSDAGSIIFFHQGEHHIRGQYGRQNHRSGHRIGGVKSVKGNATAPEPGQQAFNFLIRLGPVRYHIGNALFLDVILETIAGKDQLFLNDTGDAPGCGHIQNTGWP